jgi:hypothetical protein
MSRLKGWMIDAARLPEPLDYYRQVIDQCAAWGLNTILFRITDDQGSALRFASHPELEAHLHAYTPQELTGLAEYAARKGVDLIPEIESFGHTGFITRCPAYSHLLDEDPQEHAHFTGILPCHPDTLALLADLYREIANIFPSPYLHAGCDEVNWGRSTYSQSLIAKEGRAAVWARHINSLQEIARENDRQLMIWADHPLYGDAKILPLLNREIILVDWNYWETDPEIVLARAATALQSGFRLVGSPAWIWCRWSVRPGEAQLANIAAFNMAYARIEDPACLGVIITNWVPSRYLNHALWDGLAYAAAHPGADQLSVWRAFIENHYRASWAPAWGDLYQLLYSLIPPRQACARLLPGPYQPEAWHDPASLTRAFQQHPADPLPLADLLIRAQRCESLVKQNHASFQALILSLGYLAHLQYRHQALFQIVRQENPEPNRAVAVLEAVALADEKMEQVLDEDWNLNRYPDDPAKNAPLPRLAPQDQSLYAIRQAAWFSRLLAEHPDQFWHILKKTQPET